MSHAYFRELICSSLVDPTTCHTQSRWDCCATDYLNDIGSISAKTFRTPLPFSQQLMDLRLNSFSKGWPLVSMEALCAGLPVVMSDVGDARRTDRLKQGARVCRSEPTW